MAAETLDTPMVYCTTVGQTIISHTGIFETGKTHPTRHYLHDSIFLRRLFIDPIQRLIGR
jgi:hypothetical protein